MASLQPVQCAASRAADNDNCLHQQQQISTRQQQQILQMQQQQKQQPHAEKHGVSPLSQADLGYEDGVGPVSADEGVLSLTTDAGHTYEQERQQRQHHHHQQLLSLTARPPPAGATIDAFIRHHHQQQQQHSDPPSLDSGVCVCCDDELAATTLDVGSVCDGGCCDDAGDNDVDDYHDADEDGGGGDHQPRPTVVAVAGNASSRADSDDHNADVSSESPRGCPGSDGAARSARYRQPPPPPPQPPASASAPHSGPHAADDDVSPATTAACDCSCGGSGGSWPPSTCCTSRAQHNIAQLVGVIADIRSEDRRAVEYDYVPKTDMKLAAELGMALLERNQELEEDVRTLHAAIEEQSREIECLTTLNCQLRGANEAQLEICKELEQSVADLERNNRSLQDEGKADKKRLKELRASLDLVEQHCEELQNEVDTMRSAGGAAGAVGGHAGTFSADNGDASLPMQRRSSPGGGGAADGTASAGAANGSTKTGKKRGSGPKESRARGDRRRGGRYSSSEEWSPTDEESGIHGSDESDFAGFEDTPLELQEVLRLRSDLARLRSQIAREQRIRENLMSNFERSVEENERLRTELLMSRERLSLDALAHSADEASAASHHTSNCCSRRAAATRRCEGLRTQQSEDDYDDDVELGESQRVSNPQDKSSAAASGSPISPYGKPVVTVSDDAKAADVNGADSGGLALLYEFDTHLRVLMETCATISEAQKAMIGLMNPSEAISGLPVDNARCTPADDKQRLQQQQQQQEQQQQPQGQLETQQVGQQLKLQSREPLKQSEQEGKVEPLSSARPTAGSPPMPGGVSATLCDAACQTEIQVLKKRHTNCTGCSSTSAGARPGVGGAVTVPPARSMSRFPVLEPAVVATGRLALAGLVDLVGCGSSSLLSTTIKTPTAKASRTPSSTASPTAVETGTRSTSAFCGDLKRTNSPAATSRSTELTDTERETINRHFEHSPPEYKKLFVEIFAVLKRKVAEIPVCTASPTRTGSLATHPEELVTPATAAAAAAAAAATAGIVAPGDDLQKSSSTTPRFSDLESPFDCSLDKLKEAVPSRFSRSYAEVVRARQHQAHQMRAQSQRTLMFGASRNLSDQDHLLLKRLPC